MLLQHVKLHKFTSSEKQTIKKKIFQPRWRKIRLDREISRSGDPFDLDLDNLLCSIRSRRSGEIDRSIL